MQQASCEDASEEQALFEEPIHLLRPSEDHRCLVAEPAAIKRLESLGPISVLAVVGNQRGGKSTLMNLLHGRRLHGFQMGHYMDPQTFGLWVWPKQHPTRPGVSILLVDSEGLDSPHVPQHYNWLISAVTLLMSDVFMYQTKGSIEQSSADRLDMILKVADQLQKARTNLESQDSCGRGSFVWLLRDHQLKMKRTPREELIEMLEPAQVRSLRRVFEDFDCVPLPRPASDELLAHLDQHSFDDLSSEFREEFVVFERRLHQLLGEPRRLLGGSLTGAGLAEILSQYLSAIQQQKGILGDICQMPTQRELLKQMAGRRAIKSGMDRYEQQIEKAGLRGTGAKTQLPVRPTELLAGHESARSAALEAFSIEASSAGLEDDEVHDTLQTLECQLASWGPVLELADAGKHLGDTCAVEAPTLVRTTRLQGGCLWDLWNENAKRSKDAYESWFAELFSTDSSAVEPLEAHYTGMAAALTNVTDESRVGPWGALHAAGAGGREQRHFVLSAAQQGDRLVLAHMEHTEKRLRDALRTRLEELQARTLETERRAEAIQEALTKRLEELQARMESAVKKSLQTLSNRLEEQQSKQKEMQTELQGALDERITAHRALEHIITELATGFQDTVARNDQESAARKAEFAEENAARKAAMEELTANLETSLASRVQDATYARMAMEERLELGFRQAVEEAQATHDESLQAIRTRTEQLSKEREEDGKRISDALAQLEQCQEACKTVAEQVSEASTNSTVNSLLAALETRLSGELRVVAANVTEGSDAVDACLAKVKLLPESLAVDIQSAISPLREQLGSFSDLEERLVARLEQKSEESSGLVQTRLDASIARGQQRIEQRIEAKLADLRQALASDREQAARFEKELQVCAEDRERFSSFMSNADLDSMWESFAQLASRLSDVQCTVDDFIFRQGGCKAK